MLLCYVIMLCYYVMLLCYVIMLCYYVMLCYYGFFTAFLTAGFFFTGSSSTTVSVSSGLL